jgi:hypothetical protein
LAGDGPLNRMADPVSITVDYPTVGGRPLAVVSVGSLSAWVSETAGAADVTGWLATLVEEHGEAHVLLAAAASLIVVQGRRG